jgi:preprotein translocase subunit SecF
MNQDEVQGVECGVEHLKLTLSSRHSGVKIQSEETVGPAIGEYLRKSAWKLTLLAIILMSVYLAFRFEIKYSVGAMCSLVHDIAMSIAFCGIMGIEFDITILAALLTLYGYSVNDTIVVFDRIREINQLKSKITFTEIINKGITQTLVRTILTGVATLYTLSVIYFVGGETLRDFALVMIFGILVGTFSSIFIAPPALLWWEKWRSK